MLALGAEQILEGLTATFSRHALLDHASSIFFSAAANLVQHKSLRVANGCTDLSPTTLIDNDVIRTCENAKYMQLYPNSLSSLIGGVAVLLYSVGMSGLVGLAASALILGLNAWIATYARDAEEENLQAADIRLSVIEQIIESITSDKTLSLGTCALGPYSQLPGRKSVGLCIDFDSICNQVYNSVARRQFVQRVHNVPIQDSDFR